MGSDTSCKLYPQETIHMKCQIKFSRQMSKLFQNVICWNFYPAWKIVNPSPAEPGYTLPLQTVKKPTDLDLHYLPLSM